MAGQGLLPLKLASETLTWLQSIFRCPRAAVLLIRHSPCLLALGVVAVLHPINAGTGQAGLAGPRVWGALEHPAQQEPTDPLPEL